MNTTTFTTEQLRRVIPILLKFNKGMMVNECGYDKSFCEFSLSREIDIKFAEESKGFVYVNFEQHYSGDEGLDNLDAWTWKYSTIQVIEDVKECIKELEKHTRCQCLYEIENNLPRTKFCMVPCKAQRESRKLNR